MIIVSKKKLSKILGKWWARIPGIISEKKVVGR